MTKRERAIRALLDGLWFDGQLVTDLESMGPSQLGRIVDRIAAIMTEPDEPPEGKLRVRVLVAMAEGGEWFANSWASGGREDFEECLFMSCEEPQFRWIEADVTPWQPPSEETVQGREVDHD